MYNESKIVDCVNPKQDLNLVQILSHVEKELDFLSSQVIRVESINNRLFYRGESVEKDKSEFRSEGIIDYSQMLLNRLQLLNSLLAEKLWVIENQVNEQN